VSRRHLISRMLVVVPEKWLTVEQVLAHHWFDSMAPMPLRPPATNDERVLPPLGGRLMGEILGCWTGLFSLSIPCRNRDPVQHSCSGHSQITGCSDPRPFTPLSRIHPPFLEVNPSCSTALSGRSTDRRHASV
jgi:hypothetical protein